MLGKLLFLSVFCLWVTSGQRLFNDLHLADPFSDSWNWHHGRFNLFSDPNRYHYRNNNDGDLVEEVVTERDREPLDPNYHEPEISASEDKPTLPTNHNNKKPSFDPSVLPDGIVDVDAVTTNVDQFIPTFPTNSFGFGSFPNTFSLGGFFNVNMKPWWQGPNVCIEREEITDDDDSDGDSKKNTSATETIPNLFGTSISMSNCQETPNKYECVTKINNHGVVKTFMVRYKCCYGFVRSKDKAGCEKLEDLKTVLETIDNLEGVGEFRNLIKTTGLEDEFKNGNYTIFVATNKALESYNNRVLETNNVNKVEAVRRRRRDITSPLSSKDLVLSHTVKGFVDLSDLTNEEILYNENNNNTIRINIYHADYQKLITANCEPIHKGGNKFAKNGIVHVVNKIVVPTQQSIVDVIREHPQLTNFRQVLESSDLIKKFKENGHYTVFAPIDAAFDKLDSNDRQKLLKGDNCATSIVQHHVVTHTICSSAIIANVTTHNVEGELLHLEHTDNDELIIENQSKLIETDLLTTNGVIHLIDTILIPDSAMHLTTILKNENLTRFYELVEKAGLTDEIDNLQNVTAFIPSNQAFEEEKSKKLLEEIGDDPEKLRDLVKYHTVRGKLESCEMNNDALLKTAHNKQLRLNLYSTLPFFSSVINRATINCARIIGFDEKACGSVIHEVDKLLQPPKDSLLDLIRNNEKFSTFNRLLNGTETEKILQNSSVSLTLLAPTDETFATVDDNDLNTLYEDKEKADEVLKNHILKEVLCCSGVGQQTWGFNSLVPTLSHQHHQIGRSGNRQIHIGRGLVTSCDNLATNGVLHTINRVLFPTRPHPPSSYGGFFVFDF